MTTVMEEFDKLVEEKKFGDTILVAWAYVEYIINLLMIEQLGYTSDRSNKNARDLIDNIDFQHKWDFIKGLDLFKDNEKGKISKFHKERNKLFHGALFSFPKFHNGKEELVTSAKDAFYTVLTVYSRKHNIPLGDIPQIADGTPEVKKLTPELRIGILSIILGLFGIGLGLLASSYPLIPLGPNEKVIIGYLISALGLIIVGLGIKVYLQNRRYLKAKT